MLQDLTHTMFFKANFDIETNSDQDALWELIREIRCWLQKKAERDNYELAWDNKTWTQIKAGSLIKSNDETVVLRSCMHVENNVYTWACKVIEDRDTSNKYAPRQWITEIGFRGETISKGCVSLVLSYIDRPGFIGSLQSEPNLTTPGIIKLLLNSNKMRCSVSGTRVSAEATQIQNALDTFRLITNPERSIPVIVIAPTLSGSLPIAPNDLSKMLGPNAVVLYTDNTCVLEELNSYLAPFELHCLPGALRIYRDKLDLNKSDEVLRHRYISAKLITEIGEDEVLRILRRALAQDVYFWQKMLRIEDVKRLNRNASREKDLRVRYQDETLEDMLELESAKEEAELFAEQILEEKEDLAAQKYDIESRYKSLMQSFNQMRQSSASIASDLHKHMASMSKLPSTPSEIANLAKHVFRDRIDFTEKGWRSLEDCTTANDMVWQALYDISTILHPLFSENNSVDIVKTFGDQSRFEYAKTEGPQTRKDAKLMAQRTDFYQNREINIEPHISSKTGDPSNSRFIRVYFAWDKPSNKIVIGQCGNHMPNHTSRTIH